MELKNILNKYRKEILESLLSKKMPSIDFFLQKDLVKDNRKEEIYEIKKEDEERKIKMVRFLQAVPQFIGDDLIVYGPFENEDIASLPRDVANLLIKKTKAEEINLS